MSTTDQETTGIRMPDPAVRERAATAVTGAVGPAAGLLPLAGAVGAGFAVPDEGAGIAPAVLVALLGAVMAPGEAKVLQCFGRCTGTVPEIADAMLQRQQAGAVVAARSRIVEGAVGMAMERLSERGILDEERRAAMVSGPVVLCGDRATQPIIDAGSLC